MGGTISYDPKPQGDRRFISKWTRDLQRLCPHEGDLIEFYRSPDYSHWGLYMGSDQIVHFNTKNKNDRNHSIIGEIDIFAEEEAAYYKRRENKFVPGIITIDKLQDVAKVPGCPDKLNKIRINNKPALRDAPRKFDEIRSLVTKLVSASSSGLTFYYCSNLFNCEHFVTFLKFNRPFTELKWNNNSCGTIYETKEVKRLYREVFTSLATNKPITVYDSSCYWIIHFMSRTKQQWEENLIAIDEERSPNLLIGELHMEIIDFMSTLENSDLSN